MAAEDPKEIVDAILDVYDHTVAQLTKRRLPWTTEDARAITLSACIEASKHNWNPYTYLTRDEGPAPSSPPPQESAPPSNGYQNQTHGASPKSAGLLTALIQDAKNGLVKLGGHSMIEADKLVKANLLDAFQSEWKKPLNMANPKVQSQGQVSWAIDWMKANFGEPLRASGRTDV